MRPRPTMSVPAEWKRDEGEGEGFDGGARNTMDAILGSSRSMMCVVCVCVCCFAILDFPAAPTVAALLLLSQCYVLPLPAGLLVMQDKMSTLNSVRLVQILCRPVQKWRRKLDVDLLVETPGQSYGSTRGWTRSVSELRTYSTVRRSYKGGMAINAAAPSRLMSPRYHSECRGCEFYSHFSPGVEAEEELLLG